MDKKKVVQKFLDSGFLVSPKMLDKIDESNIDNHIERAKQVVVKEDINKGEKTNKTKTGVEVIFRKRRAKNMLTVQDFMKYYNKIYDHLRNILLKKTNATSINKIANISSEVTVIGMIKEISAHGFVLEDPTGQVEVMANQVPSANSVISVTGVVRENKLFKKEIVYPDVPLPKVISTMDARLLLSTDKDIIKNNPHDIVISTTENKDKSVHKISFTPIWADIMKDEKKITILIFTPETPIEESNAVDVLRARILPVKTINPNNNILIDDVPDIFWIIQENEWIKNYKGITIISSDKSTSINLKTREAKAI
ncbi:MAG: hypothetical protein ABIH52_00035 [Candidatus Aenigmatarchaeota archaeon]